MVDTWTLADIRIRDPFIAWEPEGAEYWLFGSTDPTVWSGDGIGFDAYRSTDLATWEGPIPAFRPPAGFWSRSQFWAPEVHRYRGRWYMFATFLGRDGRRGTQILRAENPAGPFAPWSDGPVTPTEWQCLDGTLFVDDGGQPWIVYCHEWVQVGDGTVVAQRLSEDLRECVGEPIELFAASSAPWVKPYVAGDAGAGDPPVYVTDGPFLVRLESSELVMLWSSFGENGYAVGVVRSASGSILGPWQHQAEALMSENGGHGMIFHTPSGSQALVVHQPNESPEERAIILPLVVKADGTLRLT